MRQRAVERLERHGFTCRVGHVHDHRRRLCQPQPRQPGDAEREAARVHDRRIRRGARDLTSPVPTCSSCVSWKFGSAPGRRIHVDEHVVAARARQVDGQCEATARGDGRVLVHDRREVVAHDDQVDAGVRPRAGAEAREDLAVRRPHGEVQRRRTGLARRSPGSASRACTPSPGRSWAAPGSRLRLRSRRRRWRARPVPRRGARSLALREQVARVRRDVAADLEHDLVVPLQRHPARIAVPCPAVAEGLHAAGEREQPPRGEPLAPDREQVAERPRTRAVDEDRARRVERVQRIGAAAAGEAGEARPAAAAGAGRCPRAAAAPCGRRRSRRAPRRRRARWRSACRRPCVRSRPHAKRPAARTRVRATPAAEAGARRAPARSQSGRAVSRARQERNARFTQREGCQADCARPLRAAAAGLELREQFLATVILVGLRRRNTP